MERISSHSSLSSLERSEAPRRSHEAEEGQVGSSFSAVIGEGQIEAGGRLERLTAGFRDQDQQQVRHSTQEEARSDIASSLDALGGRAEAPVAADEVAPRAPQAGASLEARLHQVEITTGLNRARFEGNWRGFDAEHQQAMIARMAGEIIENHNSLIGLLRDSNELPVENVRETRERLKNDCDNLKAITSNNRLQPESKEEGELKESKEEEMPLTFQTALGQIAAALDHADEVVEFLRENLPVAHHEQEGQAQPQIAVHRNSDSDQSNETLPHETLERGSLGSSEGTVDLLTSPPAPQGNAVAENNSQLQHFIGRIIGGTHAQTSAYTFHRDNAQAAEGRRDWSGAHLHWMSAVNRAAHGMRTIENHQQENNEVHQNPTVDASLRESHVEWRQLQNMALARAQQANANDRCCTIS